MSNYRYLTSRQVSELTGYCGHHLRRLETQGLFPYRRKLGANKVAYLEVEVVEWCKSRPVVMPPPDNAPTPNRAAR